MLVTPRLSDPIPFDRERWLSESGMTGRATGSEPSLRSRMVTDLVDHRLRAGATKRDVGEMLGPPLGGGAEDSNWRYAAGWEAWPLGFARHAGG